MVAFPTVVLEGLYAQAVLRDSWSGAVKKGQLNFSSESSLGIFFTLILS